MTNITNKESYFACADTCAGFINYFGNIFDSQNLEKLYIVKGDIKSLFLKEIAKTAEEKKYASEYILCPYNPEYLYGVLIKDLKIAIIDEKLYTHDDNIIIENIINFNDFYNESKLTKRKKEISELKIKKAEYINSAYKFLTAANELCENITELSKKYIYREKLICSVQRLIDKYIGKKHLQENNINYYADEYIFINSISFLENIELNIFENEAKKIFYISNECFLGWYYINIIISKCGNLCKVICPDTLNPRNIRAVYLKNLKILFVIKDKTSDKDKIKIYDNKYHFINIKRFLNINIKKENKQKLKFIQKCYKAIINEAVKYFKEADIINSAVENIYASAIKINEKNKYTENIIKNIFT